MSKAAVVAVVTTLLATAGSATAVSAAEGETDWVMAERMPSRLVDPLESVMADQTSLIHRSLDADHDGLVSLLEASSAVPTVSHALFDGVSKDDWASFVQIADSNNDLFLSKRELNKAVAKGLAGSYPELIESDSRRGIFSSIGNAIKGFAGKVTDNLAAKTAATIRKVQGKVDATQDGCVMCQYIVERLETNVRNSGVIPSMPTGDVPLYVSTSNDNPFSPYAARQAPGPAPDRGGQGEAPQQQPKASAGGSAAGGSGETGTTTDGSTTDGKSFLEVEAHAQDPYDAAGAGIIAATRESTRLQRQMERQKYDEIYRVVDITLDDVCEQGMPAPFYGYCKQIYQAQSDVVDGLRYQYRPSDICFRVGMCGKASYITKGIHSRYQA